MVLLGNHIGSNNHLRGIGYSIDIRFDLDLFRADVGISVYLSWSNGHSRFLSGSRGCILIEFLGARESIFLVR